LNASGFDGFTAVIRDIGGITAHPDTPWTRQFPPVDTRGVTSISGKAGIGIESEKQEISETTGDVVFRETGVAGRICGTVKVFVVCQKASQSGRPRQQPTSAKFPP
jgi:hypothetical protein